MKSIAHKVALISPIILFSFTRAFDLKPHERWWQNNVTAQMNTFDRWLGDINARSRSVTREHIKRMGYKTVLDIPAGLCTEYFGYKENRVDIAYLGIDITPKLVERGKALGVPIKQGSIEAIPLPNNGVEVCYARHILEHLDYYTKAVQELIRVASKEVIIVFFIAPSDKKDAIRKTMRDGNLLYHNRYNKQKLESLILSDSKTKNVEWQYIKYC